MTDAHGLAAIQQSPEGPGPFRKRYRQLSADEVALHDKIKDAAAALFDIYEQAKPSRELSLGKTKLEESVMWAVKGLTA